jgi:hypothetical protein
MLKDNWNVIHEEFGKVDPTWYNKKLYEKVVITKPPKLNIKNQLVNRLTNARWHYLLAASVALMLVGKKYSNVQIQQLLFKKGFEVGVILFAISLYFTFKKLTRNNDNDRRLTSSDSGIILTKAISQAESVSSVRE